MTSSPSDFLILPPSRDTFRVSARTRNTSVFDYALVHTRVYHGVYNILKRILKVRAGVRLYEMLYKYVLRTRRS